MTKLKKKTCYVCLDLDDYSDARNGLDWLWKLRARFKRFKVTLWTVFGWSTPQFLQMSSKWKWAELGMHGWTHEADEVQHWDQSHARSLMGAWKDMGFTKGFHSPGWGRSKGVQEVLLEEGWFYQAHPKFERAQYYPEQAPVEGLKVYYPGENSQQIGQWDLYGLGWGQEPLEKGRVLRIHGHTGKTGVTNSIDYLSARLLQFPEDTEFLFVSELFDEKNNTKG